MLVRMALVFLLFPLFLFASSNMQKVLILHSYNESYNWTKNIQNGIDLVLDATKYEIHVEYMDTKRYSSKEYYKKLKELYLYKYKNTKFDVIIVSDNNSLKFIQLYKKELFGDTPIVFCGINYFKKSDISGLNNITGISEEADVAKNFKLIKKLHPHIKDLYIVVDVTTTGHRVRDELEEVIKKMPDSFDYHILQGYSLDEVDKFLKDKNGVVLLTVFFKDKYKKNYEYYELINRLKNEISMPIYGLWDINLGNGIIGGYLTSGLFQGKMAAKMAKKILDGESIESIGILKRSPNKYMFDFKMLKKYGIDLKKLPEKHYMINYQKSIWEIYKKELIFAIVLIFFLLIGIILLSMNIRKRKKAELALLESERGLEQKVKERTQELSDSLEELKRTQKQLVYSEKMASLGGLVAGVAHEINTPIGLGLTGMTHFMDITVKINELYLQDNLSKDEFEEYLKSANQLAVVILANLKKSAQLVRSFKQVSVDQASEEKREFNLKAYTNEVLLSLTNLTKNRQIDFDVECEDITVYSYPGAYSQILTNLVVNVLNHAFGKNHGGVISIKVSKKAKKLFIEFSDNGKGIKKEYLPKIFDPFFTTNRKNGGSGLGLNIVYNIVKTTFLGNITCSSEEKEGTTFHIELTL